MLRPLSRSVLSALAGLALVLPSAAQEAPLPDGLDGAPCADVSNRANLVLPPFPAFTQASLQVCWLDCDVEATKPLSVHWSSPLDLTPDVQTNDMLSVMRMRDAGGTLHWRGKMRLTYSRTWLEEQLLGNTLQVWRFLVNGDLRSTPGAGGSPVFVPSCAAEFNNRVRYTGYVDWAKDLTTGSWSNAWMLTHSLGAYEHDPAFPYRGGVGAPITHNRRVNCFVGPEASFIPTPLVPHVLPSSPTPQEAVRRVENPFLKSPMRLGESSWRQTALTHYEEPVLPFQMQSLDTSCACDGGGSFPQFASGPFSLGGSCGTSLTTEPLVGPFEGYYLSMSIGLWGDPLSYPGMEMLRWNMGSYRYFEPTLPEERVEVFYGVTTLRGYEPTALTENGPGVPLEHNFIDQCNCLSAGGTTKNTPFYTDHILNLNVPPPPPGG